MYEEQCMLYLVQTYDNKTHAYVMCTVQNVTNIHTYNFKRFSISEIKVENKLQIQHGCNESGTIMYYYYTYK